jgi:prenyltransferase beta subunit
MNRFLSVGVILLLAAPVLGQTAEQKKATIAYLQKLQNKDGGFRPNAAVETSSLRATSSALRALKYFGGEVPDRAAAAEFVKKCHDKASGGFADTSGGKPDVALTAVGIMALVELKIPTEPYEAGAIKFLDGNVKTFEDVRIAVAGLEAIGKAPTDVRKWRELVEKRLVPTTDAGAARDAGGAAVALLRMGVKPESADVLKVLVQRPDGGFAKGEGASDLESTYRVMRCFHMLKKQPGDPGRLRAFVAACRNDDGGYGVAPAEKSAVGSTYFASIILHWLDEK